MSNTPAGHAMPLPDAADNLDNAANAADALLAAYTRAVLEFRLGGADAAPPPKSASDTGATEDSSQPPGDAAAISQAVEKALRLAVRSGRPHLVLLGVGDGRLPDALAKALRAMEAGPCSPRLTVCDLAPDRLRAALAAGHLKDSGQDQPSATAPRLLADTSPWALLLLLRAAGIAPETATLFPHPFLPDAEADALRRWRRLFAACVPVELPAAPAALAALAALEDAIRPAPCHDLGVGAILHPDEPDLAAFLAQIPGWVREVAVVWDGAPPAFDPAPLCPVPLRQAVRALGGDFSAQRNAMLELLSTGWTLYLDADERLSPATWALLPRLMAVPGTGAWLFPRVTAYPDADHLRAGYGLWPDMQLRLFRRTPGVRFDGRVHERVVGIDSHTCLLADAWIDHLSWTAKDRKVLAERLRVFDAAGASGEGSSVPPSPDRLHRLSAEYPALPRSLFAAVGLMPSEDAQAHRRHTALRLPLSP